MAMTNAPVVLSATALRPAALETPGIDLSVRRGERVGLWGPSGSGKTALLRTLAGLDRAPSGRLLWGDRDVTRRNAPGRGARFASLVLENPYRLFASHYTVGKLLDVYRLDRGQFRALSQASGLLASLSDQRIGALSGGWRVRLAVLCAVLNDPSIVFIDDVWKHLVPESWAELWAALDIWVGETRSLVVASRWWQALQGVDTLVVLREGQVVEFGRRDALLSDPQDPYTRSLRSVPPGDTN